MRGGIWKRIVGALALVAAAFLLGPSDAVADSLEMAAESYGMAESARVEAIERQIHGAATAPLLSAPVVPAVFPRLGGPIARSARRALRQGYLAVPVVPPLQIEVYRSPWPTVPQPNGHVREWTGPNGYVYRPTYQSPIFSDVVPPNRWPAEDAQGGPVDAPEPWTLPSPVSPDLEDTVDAEGPAELPRQRIEARPVEAGPQLLPPLPAKPESIVPEVEIVPAPLAEPDGPREF